MWIPTMWWNDCKNKIININRQNFQLNNLKANGCVWLAENLRISSDLTTKILDNQIQSMNATLIFNITALANRSSENVDGMNEYAFIDIRTHNYAYYLYKSDFF